MDLCIPAMTVPFKMASPVEEASLLTSSHVQKYWRNCEIYQVHLRDFTIPIFHWCDKSISELRDDLQTLVGAGSIKIRLVLTFATYHVLNNRCIRDALMDYLTVATPDATEAPPIVKLEQLPHFAVTPGLAYQLVKFSPALESISIHAAN